MRISVAPEHGPQFDDALEELLAAEPYLPYANFPAIAQRDAGARGLHRERWRRAAEARAVWVARGADRRPLAALWREPRAFESAHFGLQMVKTAPPLAVADEASRLAALRALYQAIVVDLRRSGHQHVSSDVSTHDRVTAWAVQESGARYVGTKISWMQALTGRRAAPALPPPLRIELIDAAAIPAIDPASWRRLSDWSGQAFDRGPFVYDLQVPHARALGIYQVWTHKAMTGEWADVLLVVRDGEEIVAFHTMLVLDDLSAAAGVRILGRGIGGTLPGYRGLFTALQKECAAARPLGAAFLENETQTSTIQSINVFGKLGHHCLRSTASFHLRLDEHAPAP